MYIHQNKTLQWLNKYVHGCHLSVNKISPIHPTKVAAIRIGVGQLFVLCAFYADGIALLSASCYSVINDGSDTCRKCCSQFNNIMSVLGKQSNEMSAVHLVKTYRSPTLMRGCKAWTLTGDSLHKLNTVWNNSFRRIFSGCWRESTRPLRTFSYLWKVYSLDVSDMSENIIKQTIWNMLSYTV